MSNLLRVGQKVTLVKAFPASEIQRARYEGVSLPAHGEVYTIRDMEPSIRDPSQLFIRLVELQNGPHVIDGIEPSFRSDLFRPVVERKSDISIFKAMLTRPRLGVRV